MLLVTLIALQGCSATPEPEKEIITIYKTEFKEGIKPDLPSRPSPLIRMEKEPEIFVITPETMYSYYHESVMGSDLSDEAKKSVVEYLDIITKLTMSVKPYALIGYKQDTYFEQAALLKDVTRWVKEANANFDYIESLNLTVLPVEESSGKD